MTTARPQQRYAHRLRELVHRTGDLTIATDLGVPPSTARGWLGTTLGKALKTLRNLLDPKRSDSVQSLLEQAVKTVTCKEGALAKAVKEVVAEAVNPLATEVDKLTKEVRGQEAAAEALEQTTLKGTPYEEEITGILQVWAGAAGAEVQHVGGDNHPGDVLITVRGFIRDVEAQHRNKQNCKRCSTSG